MWLFCFWGSAAILEVMPFEYTKLIVYQRALDAMEHHVHAIACARPGWKDLVNQLKRASTSVVLNIAEGAGEYRSAEKARFYRMALRSAAEAHAAYDILVRVQALTSENVIHAQNALGEVAAMLVAMCKSIESRPEA